MPGRTRRVRLLAIAVCLVFVYFLPIYSPPAIHWTKQPEKWPITSTIQLPSGTPKPIPLVQKKDTKGADKQRLAAVKEACKHAWSGYRKHGWGYDEVEPVSGYGKNSFNGWGATLVDSLDTLWIMGMKDEFEDAVNQTKYIDFTTSSRNDIPLFEVTIRYLGGLVGAYDVSGRQYRVLLDKAVELAEILYSAFDTPNRMPETYYYWKPSFSSNGHRASTRVVMAELGTLSLEFTRLAQLTKEPKYYDAVARITDAFEEWQNQTRIPGMWPTTLDASLRSVSSHGMESFTLGGQSDSTYEYLPKMHLLIGGQFDQYKDMYLASMIPWAEKGLFRPMTPDNLDILISGEIVSAWDYDNETYYETKHSKGEHLTCFAGGMFAMGGKLFDLPEHVEIGRKLTDGCIWAYNATTSGIMPEGFIALACPDKNKCEWNETIRKYILRPEAIESVFYMYRITGEQYWRDMGWKMFRAIDKHTRARYGHSALDDITKLHPEQLDGMESFWIAETLKYFYLLFDEPDVWSLDDWVMNTEAHFFRRPENPLGK
ncbi:glycoside hydrolase family 47 protein [Pseudocercospora fijiensis CIRAD86]|uniref:alpha-1,2-Mannosidase n=1 Tax=Pseudocercospora fijiensis (strain CIRAD86) TaxID=383855 RepID=M2YII3_PSEFD|nr:glycoside hydrolase family 47 protein [Pseudocercospora fijiensis CIRAD86]EME77585.1 glycoside hydrolase family 47 protein [Pseudocercospora fijiensis CIRAD86]